MFDIFKKLGTWAAIGMCAPLVLILIVPAALIFAIGFAVWIIASEIVGWMEGRVGRKELKQPPPKHKPVQTTAPEPGPVATKKSASEQESKICTIEGTLFRYQAREHLHHGEDFYKTFIDGPWKWSGHQRFAGLHVSSPPAETDRDPFETKINIGHFFGTTRRAAEAEISHYSSDTVAESHALMEVIAEIGNVLDLTDLGTIRSVAEAMGIGGNIWDIVAELISTETGGSEITTAFGYHAQREGYSGFAFYSARDIRDRHAKTLRNTSYWDDVAEEMEKTPVWETMKRRPSGLCVVMNSGAVTTQSIKQFRYDGGDWHPNRHFNADEQTIFDLWGEYGEDYQASQGRVIYIKTG